jgi:hypothetical protein
LTANGLGLSNPKESGIFTSLPAGQFTAILAGKNGGVGLGLVEVYNLKWDRGAGIEFFSTQPSPLR